ncbi:MAG TPA: hypothetical protein VGE66_06950, partial [Chitinophagaceae bacterium]
MTKALPGLLLLFLLFFRVCLQAQITISDGTKLSILPGTSVALGGDMVLMPGSVLEQQGSLSFKGNFTQNGTAGFLPGSRLLANGTTR